MRCKEMERWGSSYLLHDVMPTQLIATLGSSTSLDAVGSVGMSFTRTEGVLTATRDATSCRVHIKWSVAINLMALLHVLVLQNRLLRGESPEFWLSLEGERTFRIAGGMRTGSIEIVWDASAADVTLEPFHEGGPDQFQLVMKERAAAALLVCLAERFAEDGTMTSRVGRGAP